MPGQGNRERGQAGGVNSRYQVWHIWNSASGVGCLNNWPTEVINSHDLTGVRYKREGMGGGFGGWSGMWLPQHL